MLEKRWLLPSSSLDINPSILVGYQSSTKQDTCQHKSAKTKSNPEQFRQLMSFNQPTKIDIRLMNYGQEIANHAPRI